MIQSIPDVMWNAIQHLFIDDSLRRGRKTKNPYLLLLPVQQWLLKDISLCAFTRLF